MRLVAAVFAALVALSACQQRDMPATAGGKSPEADVADMRKRDPRQEQLSAFERCKENVCGVFTFDEGRCRRAESLQALIRYCESLPKGMGEEEVGSTHPESCKRRIDLQCRDAKKDAGFPDTSDVTRDELQ